MATSPTTVLVRQADGVLTITLNRPDTLNALNTQMGVELIDALLHAHQDATIRCVVLTGAGRGFCSGQDVRALRPGSADRAISQDLGDYLREVVGPVTVRLRTLEKPVLAAINGVVAGVGVSFALAADLRLCAASASFKMAFVHVGLVPDAGSTLTLVQHVGYARAAELCMLGETVSAERALQIGLVNRVVADDDLMAETDKLAARLAALPTRALGLTKLALNHSWNAALSDQLEHEARAQSAAGHTADHREGVAAFLEKRAPRFGGR